MNLKKRILIIDEEIDVCLFVKAYFLRKDYEVYISRYCREAFSLADETQPNIIFFSTSVCRDPDDIAKIKASVPDAEIIIDNLYKFPDV